jgi:hypothetical protein
MNKKKPVPDANFRRAQKQSCTNNFAVKKKSKKKAKARKKENPT